MSVHPNADRPPDWPVLDRRRQHIRSPIGTIIPLAVLRPAAAIVVVLIGLKLTFGLTNWIFVPAFLLTCSWVGRMVETATIVHRLAPDSIDGSDRR